MYDVRIKGGRTAGLCSCRIALFENCEGEVVSVFYVVKTSILLYVLLHYSLFPIVSFSHCQFA